MSIQIAEEGGGGGGGGSSTFTGLDDTPANYVGDANKFLVVKATEDGVDFVTILGVATNLSVGSVTGVSFEIDNDNGTNVVIPEAVNGGDAGLLSGADKAKIDAINAKPVEFFTGTAKNLVVADDLKFFVMDNVAAQTVTIPEEASEAFPVGAEMEFLRENATGTVTFVVSGAAVLQSRDALVMINAQYSAATLKKIDTDEWRLIGDLA